MNNQSNDYCQDHEFLLEDEIVCRDDIHYCHWCQRPIGPCTCFEGFVGSLDEISVIKRYFLALEGLFSRSLDPVEKKAIIQQFIDFRDD